MFAIILNAAGYTLHNTIKLPGIDASCWIKDGRDDINVCNVTGLWADEHDGCGNTAATLSAFITNLDNDDAMNDFNYVGSRHHY